jgi:WD40 repeat protein
MIRQADCPDAVRLQDLLDGMLPDVEQAELTRHLDQCARCQQQLETLAVGGRPWSGISRLARWRSQAEPSLGRAIAELKQALSGPSEEAIAATRSHVAAPTEDEAEEPILDFLSPSEQPGHLGHLGPYEILEVIGHGGMGIVLKGLDPVLNRLVAIKVLAPQLAASGAARKRFAREARAAAAVSHEHVVTIHAVDVAQGLPYLVMEYVPGVSLQQRLDRDGPLELEEVLRIALQTASGLAAAHAQGVVHRDVKPANILLADGIERVKLTDFGLARAADDATITHSGYLPGTPAYMAPEQASGEGVDHRADLFSLGSVLYAMCTARPPFRASTLMGLLRRVSEDRPCPVQEINPRIPDWLVEIMNRLHAKEPARRFQSAAEVATVFAECLAQVQTPTVPRPAASSFWPTALGPRQGIKPKADRRWPRIAWAAALLICTLGLVAWAATVFRIRTPDGTLVVEVNDPDVQVTVDGQDVIISGKGIAEVKLRAGQHKVQATKDGKPVLTKLIEIRRDGREVVTVTLEPNQAASGGGGGTPLPGGSGAGSGAAVPADGPLTLKGHTARVTSVTFSPDGKLLASASGDGTARLWQADSGKMRAVLHAARGPVAGIAFFSDGKTLLTVGEDGTLQLWDVLTGKQLASLKLSASFKVSALQPDSRVLATGGDGVVTLWDIASGKELQSIHDRSVRWETLAFSPDGKLLASGSPGAVRLWDVRSGKEIRRLADDKTVRSVTFSPDGKTLVSSSSDHTVRLWDAQTGKQLRIVKSPDVVCLATSPDGKFVATGSASGTVALLEAVTGKVVRSFQEKTGAVSCLAFSPDGRRLAWGTADGSVQLWRLDGTPGARGELERLRDEVAAARAAEAVARAVAEQAEQRARASEEQARRQLYFRQITLAQQAWADNHVNLALNYLRSNPADLRGWEWHYLMRLSQEQPVSTALAGHTAAVRAVAVSPDIKRIASAGEDTTVRLWDASSGKEIARLPGHKEMVHGLVFSPDGRALAYAGDGELIVWDLTAGKIRTKAKGAGGGPGAVAFSPDGQRIAVVFGKGPVRLLDAVTGREEMRAQDILTSAGLSLAYSPDGRRVAVAGERGVVGVWDLDGFEVRKLKGHGGRVNSVAFSPDGTRLASAGEDGTILIQDVQSGKELLVLKGHRGAVLSVCFSPDGRRLVSAGQDRALCVWDADDAKQLLTLTGHKDAVTCVAFSPDGRTIVSGSTDMTIRLWLAAPSQDKPR